MKDLLGQFKEIFEKNETFREELMKFDRTVKSPDWGFFVGVLRLIQGRILEDMVSREHTLLDEKEKDVAQRTYYNINQILVFLMSPAGWIKKRSKWSQVLSNQMGKVKPNQRKEQ
uniref:Uncharacterized protein n=1 Tax=viral metagenome TaxID=1070528 RepID=A0A6H1ZGW0_9ZZZZ